MMKLDIKNNIANIVTIIRIILTVILNIYIMKYFGNILIPIIITTIIFASDFIDGKIARKLKATSDFGGKLDISSDFFYISSMYLVLYLNDVLPLWFFFVIVAKFLEFVITGTILKRNKQSIFDLIGRSVAVCFYLIPMFGYLIFVLVNDTFHYLLDITLYLIFIAALISSFYRILKVINILKKD
jgi:CDP-diacylglycerol--glycerol-3-phosphate 3-phosphatidyltransferase